MRRILAAGWLCLSLAPLSAESNTPPAVVPLSKLIEQLGDANFRNREAATKAIEDRGEKVLPELRIAAEVSPSAEARRRLQSLVGQMERAAALEPKYVTLKCTNKPVTDVLADVAKQTGYLFQYQGIGNAAALTYNFDRLTFWQAMDRICDDARLSVYHNEPNGMYFHQQDAIWPHVFYSGPFKVMVNSMHYGKSITLGQLPRVAVPNQNRSESLQFSFTVMSEPKLPIMSVTMPRVLEAIDDAGNSMMMPSEPYNAFYLNGRYKTFNQSLSMQLALPNKEAKSIKRIRFSVPLTVLASQKPEITVDDILKVKDKKFTGTSAEIHVMEVKEVNATQIQIKLNIRNRAADANQDYNWANSVQQRLELLDAKGAKYMSHGFQWENSSTGHMQGTFMFGTNGVAAIGPPAKLVYVQWGLMQHQIEVEFKDVPLP